MVDIPLPAISLTHAAMQAATVEVRPSILIDKANSWLNGFIALLPNLLVATVVVVLTWIGAKLVRRMVVKLSARRDRPNLGEILGGFFRWCVLAAGFLIAGTIVIPSLDPGGLVAGLGIGTVAIGFAFKDILQNWLAGVLILLKQPFVNGDQISVGGFTGTVQTIESRATIIKTFDGQQVVIPNSQIYTEAVLVKTAYRYRRSEYDVGIGYGDDIDTACAAMRAAVEKVPEVAKDEKVEVLPWELAASWVTIRVRWWTDTYQHSVVATHAAVIRAIKLALDDEHIDMPYETRVLLMHDQTDEADGDRAKQREGWPEEQDRTLRPLWKVRKDRALEAEDR